MLDDLIKERLKKLDSFERAGRPVFGAKSRRNRLLAEVKLHEKNVVVAGRLSGLRIQGGVFFCGSLRPKR